MPPNMSLLQKINFRFTDDARSLHGVAQIIRSNETFCPAKIVCRKKQNYFVRVVHVAQNIELLQSSFCSSRRMLVINRFPLLEISHFVANHHVHHMSVDRIEDGRSSSNNQCRLKY